MVENKSAEWTLTKKVNILVIGGAGFVGSHLCESLISNKIYNVISIDNYSSGTVDNHTSGVTYIEGDTRTLDEVNLPKFDYIYHLGEYSRVENSLEQVDQVIDNNIVGLTKVLKFCYFSNAKLIYANLVGTTQTNTTFTGANQNNSITDSNQNDISSELNEIETLQTKINTYRYNSASEKSKDEKLLQQLKEKLQYSSNRYNVDYKLPQGTYSYNFENQVRR